MPEQLLACPFCSGPGHATHDDYVHEDMRPMPVVECNACHAWVRAESWNKRAIPADHLLVPRDLIRRITKPRTAIGDVQDGIEALRELKQLAGEHGK